MAGTISSNSPQVRQAFQKHILSEFSAKEYHVRTNAEAFVKEVDHYRTSYTTRLIGVNQAIREMLNSPHWEYTYYGKLKFLNAAGLKKYTIAMANQDKISDRGWEEINRLYDNLIVMNGARIYTAVKNGATVTSKNPHATTKKRYY